MTSGAGGVGETVDATGGSVSTAGSPYTAGFDGGGGCYPQPMPDNDLQCPDPYDVSNTQLASPCPLELTCDFRVPTGGNHCFQPPYLRSFRCCGWGFVRADLPCPSLAPDSNPSCAFPIELQQPCELRDLFCEVHMNGETQGLTCCAAGWQIGPCQLK